MSSPTRPEGGVPLASSGPGSSIPSNLSVLGSVLEALSNRPTFRVIALALLFLAIAMFTEGIVKPIFGSEYPYFVSLNQDITFDRVLKEYASFHYFFYRPTGFYTIYWLLSSVFSWHNLVAWKLVHLATGIASIAAFYWLMLQIFPGRRRAALLACAYYVIHPMMSHAVVTLHMFEFPHAALTLLAAVCFLEARRKTSTRTPWLLVTAGALAYLIALTAKEMAFPLPVFLGVIALWGPGGTLEKPEKDRPASLRRELLLLAPFLIVALAYYGLHIRHIPSRPAGDDYRIDFDALHILQNIRKFPLFIVRIYQLTGETRGQTGGLFSPVNTLFGLALLGLTIRKWRELWRRGGVWRQQLKLSLAWIAVFIAIPIYSGAYIWHIHLAMLGYAMLLGIALTETIRDDWPRWTASLSWIPRGQQTGVAVLLILVLFAMYGAYNEHDLIRRGLYADSYRVSYGILDHPPVDPSYVADGATFFLDDSRHFGPWMYGNGKLMALVYNNWTIQQQEVPGLTEASMNQRADFLRANSAFYLRRDESNVWRDRTDEFRRDTANRIGGLISEFFQAGRANEVAALMDRVVEIAPERDYLFHYHYALGLQTVGRRIEAMREFNKAQEIDPKAMLVYYNRGILYEQIGNRSKACEDFAQARKLDPNYALAAEHDQRLCH